MNCDNEAAFTSGAKRMDVIGHDYVSPDMPAVSLGRRSPFLYQNAGNPF
jgi:hypothetical protein